MMFLLRTAFWLSVVILLLPSPRTSQQPEGLQVGATEAMTAASSAVSDMRQFCARQPDACAVGSQVLVQFGQKAQAGAKMLYDFLTEKLGPEHTGSVREPVKATPSVPSQHTLTPADVAPTWRGPQPRKEAELKRPV